MIAVVYLQTPTDLGLVHLSACALYPNKLRDPRGHGFVNILYCFRRRDLDGDKGSGGEGARALAQLLTLLDGFHRPEGSHVVVIGATNRWKCFIRCCFVYELYALYAFMFL